MADPMEIDDPEDELSATFHSQLCLGPLAREIFTAPELGTKYGLTSRQKSKHPHLLSAALPAAAEIWPGKGPPKRGPKKASEAVELSPRAPFRERLDPKKRELRLFYTGSSYHYDRARGTMIDVYGNMDDEDSSPILVRLQGFFPHFYIKKPVGWNSEDIQVLSEMINQELKEYCNRELQRTERSCMKDYGKLKELFEKSSLNFYDYLSGRYDAGGYGKQRDLMKLTVENAQMIRKYQFELDLRDDLRDLITASQRKSFVHEWKVITAQELHWWRPADELDEFVDFYLEHPKLVRKARTILEHPNGLRDKFRPDCWEVSPWYKPGAFEGGEHRELPDVWFEDPHGDEVTYKGFDVFEADVDFIIRQLVDQDVAPCTWFSLPAGSGWELVPLQDRISRCPVEVFTKANQIFPLKDASYEVKIPNLVKVFLDIECVTNGKFFPRSDQDHVIQVSLSLNRLHDKGHYTSYLFSLREVREVPNADHIFWYDDEREMLRELYLFLVTVVDPDVIGHHNGNGFDLPYLVNRAAILGLPDFNLLGRSLEKRVYLYQQENKGRDKHFADLEGRVNFDLMRRAMDDFSDKFDSFSLNEISDKTIGQTKAEMPYELLERHFKTMKGRERESVYVSKDAWLTHAAADKLNAVMSSMLMARLSCIPWQKAMDRSQGAKVEGKLRHHMCPRGIPLRLKRTQRKGGILQKNLRADLHGGAGGDKKDDKKGKKKGKKKDDEEEGVGYTGAIVITPRRGYYGRLKTGNEEEEEDPMEETITEEDVVARALEDAREDFGLDPDDPTNLQAPPAPQVDVSFDPRTEDPRTVAQGIARQAHEEVDEVALAMKRQGLEGHENWRMPSLNRTQRRQLYLYMRRRWTRILRFCRRKGIPLQGRFTAMADFASMYPGVIRAHNLCYTTALTKRRILHYGLQEGKDYFFVPETLVMYDPGTKRRKVLDIPSPKNAAFVYPSLHKGLLPDLEQQLGDERTRVKKKLMEPLKKEIEAILLSIKELEKQLNDAETQQKREKLQGELKTKQFDYDVLNILQETLKRLMNSIYGLTGDPTSVWYMLCIASSVTTFGRNMITRVRICGEDDFGPEFGDHFYLVALYGDTDSCKHNMVGDIRSPGEACTVGKRVVEYINKKEAFLFPQKLEFEKIYDGDNMADKKRYIALKYLFAEADPTVDTKGMAHKRKSPAAFSRDMLIEASVKLYRDQDLLGAIEGTEKRLMQLAEYRVPINQLFERTQLTKDPSEYGGEAEEIKQKPKKELKRIQELRGQKRLYDFFPISVGKKEEEEEQEPPRKKGREGLDSRHDHLLSSSEDEEASGESEDEEIADDGEGEQDNMYALEKQALESMKRKEQILESETVTRQRKIPVPAPVMVARRINEQTPDNPRRAGSIIHLLVAECDDVKTKTAKGKVKGERALEPLEAIEQQARPDINYYLKSLRAPLGTLFYYPMVSAGLIQPESLVWSPKPQPVDVYVKSWEQVEAQFADFYKEPRYYADVLLEDERMMELPRLDPDIRTKRVCDVLYRKVQRKRVHSGVLQTSALKKHVREFKRCLKCELAMVEPDKSDGSAEGPTAQLRATFCPHLCVRCEQEELLDYRARRLAHAWSVTKTPRPSRQQVKDMHARVLDGSMALMQEYVPGPDAQEQLFLRRLHRQAVQKEVNKLDELGHRANEVIRKCLSCMQGDEEGVRVCQAYSCRYFGERHLLRNDVRDQLDLLCGQYAVPASQLEW